MAAKKDYYKIMEIDKSSTEDEIKRAYRKLALKWHPDKNPSNREAAKLKFQEIAEAYSVLSDKKKREQYDRFGDAEAQPEMHFEDGGSGGFQGDFGFTRAEDIFRQFFGGEDPFAAFNSDPMFGGHHGFSKGSGVKGGDPFFGGDLFGAGFGMPFGFGDIGDEDVKGGDGHEGMFSHSSFSSGMGGGMESCSTKMSTVYKNGQQVTRTEKTRVDADGKKSVEIIEEMRDRDGNVQRTVQSLGDTEAPKSIKGWSEDDGHKKDPRSKGTHRSHQMHK